MAEQPLLVGMEELDIENRQNHPIEEGNGGAPVIYEVAADGAPGEVEDAFLERGQIGIARVPVVGETGHKQEGEERCIVPRIQRTFGDSSKRLYSLHWSARPGSCARSALRLDRTSVLQGRSGSVRVDPGGTCIIKNQ